MMNYDLFKTIVLERIGDYLPEEFRDYHAETNRVKKINGSKDSICMVPETPDEERAMPTLYLDDLYEDFCIDEDLNRVLSEVAYVFMTYGDRRVPEELNVDPGAFLDQTIVQLVNGEMNEELLGEVPHRRWMDLAIIYRVIFRRNEEGIDSFLMSYDLLDRIGVTEGELYDRAVKNTVRMFPAQRIETDESMVILTNDSGWTGAAAMLYPEEMDRLAADLGGDFFVLPSSIHEIFAVPAERCSAEILAGMLRQGNGVVTRQEEILSRSIYRFVHKESALVKCAV